jgi:hypothetical protein
MVKLKTIQEAVRSVERAKKLLDYLHKKHGNTGDREDEIEVSHANYDKHSFDRVSSIAPKGAMNPSPSLYRNANIRLDKLKPLQKYVHVPSVHDKLDKKDNKPIIVVKHGDDHYVADGHHRYFASKLKGDKHVNANVVTIGKKK